MDKKKITWVGTDYHYQESWYKLKHDENIAEARIANDVEIFYQVLIKLKARWDPPIDYDPMTELKKLLRQEDKEDMESEEVQIPDAYTVTNVTDAGEILRGDATLREGLTRKHVPFIMRARTFPKLISSIVTT